MIVDDDALFRARQRSSNWMVSSARLLDGVTFATTMRSRVAVALQHLCIEHHQGTHTLIEQNVRGSAFALYRPQFEAYARGLWYQYCASDADVKRYVNGTEPPRIGKIASDLATVTGDPGRVVEAVKEGTWAAMCAFTHGGAVQVKARSANDEIRQNYSDRHAAQLLDSAAVLSYLAALAIAAVANDSDLAKRLQEAHEPIFDSVYLRDDA
ncbi:hypothetical protein QCE73_37690 [Caballeronia sp. LZ029]|uniref:DUF6988 family protein n=1 Tax=Caballeronia sp. LZ029 TaxID=3038564 RepID=UPI00285E6A59|nr:hypothetical protein [Caballeronia sp. LZ029]MDR5748908.1 hypothetical protein [Caballeronia sp. LZ029]